MEWNEMNEWKTGASGWKEKKVCIKSKYPAIKCITHLIQCQQNLLLKYSHIYVHIHCSIVSFLSSLAVYAISLSSSFSTTKIFLHPLANGITDRSAAVAGSENLTLGTLSHAIDCLLLALVERA
jgi:hypothetical protein